MASILHVLPDLDVNGAAKQVSLLAPALVSAGFAVQVAALHAGGLFAQPLQKANIPMHDLGASHRVDLSPLRALHRLVHDLKPSIVHAWRTPALRLAVLANIWGSLRGRHGHLIVSDVPTVGERLSFIDHKLLTRTDLAANIPLAVDTSPALADSAALRQELGLPEAARVIFCAGSMENGEGSQEAAWTFEILEYVYPDLWLVMVGDGPQRERVEAFSRSVSTADWRVRFTGTRGDVPQLIQLADLVWICGRRGGRNLALEALAAARPVVAADRPDLWALLGEGAGYFVDLADRHQFARATRQLLDDPALHQGCVEAARRRAAVFALPRIVERWAELYRQWS